MIGKILLNSFNFEALDSYEWLDEARPTIL